MAATCAARRIILWTYTPVGRAGFVSNRRTEVVLESGENGGAGRQAALGALLARAEHFERRRLSEVVQDDLQQLLYGVRLMLRLAHDELDSDRRREAGQMLRQADALFLQSTQVTRQLSGELNPPVLKNEGLKSILAWLRRMMREWHGLDVELQGDEIQVDDSDARWLLFQVFHDLLFNVAKRSGARRASVILQDKVEELSVEVAGDGIGLALADAEESSRGAHGLGIASARERIRLLGGRLEIDSRPGSGTRVKVRLPRRAALDH